MVRETMGDYATKDTLTKYQALIKSILSLFSTHTLVQVDRSDNTIVDLLSNLMESEKDNLVGFFYFEELKVPATEGQRIKENDMTDSTWMTHLIDYLKEGI